MTKEYETVESSAPNVGRSEALDPACNRPNGEGWVLVNASVEGDKVFYFWEREKPKPDPNRVSALNTMRGIIPIEQCTQAELIAAIQRYADRDRGRAC